MKCDRETAAKILVKLWKDAQKWLRKNKPKFVRVNDVLMPADKPEVRLRKLREKERIEYQTTQVMEQISADPDFFDILIGWIVEVRGKNGTDDIHKMIKAFQGTPEQARENMKKMGGLQQAVGNALEQWGYNIEEMGGGTTGWHLGVHCTDKEAKTLCRRLHAKFKKAISLDLLRVHKMFTGYKLPELRGDPQFHRWIEENGEPE